MRIRRKDIVRRFRLFAALAVAAVFTSPLTREGWNRALGALRVWFDYAREPMPTPRWIYYRRMKNGCFKCPLFYRPLRTCGSPLDKRLLRTEGCWCNQDFKASMLEAECWLHNETGDRTIGWPAEGDAPGSDDPGNAEPVAGDDTAG